MRKIALLVLSLVISLNAFAENSDVGSVITKSITKQNTNRGQDSKIVYGGKDISRSILASATESSWTRQPILIG
ncbi:MAG: hypothetical protein ABI597_00085 [Gammaproteobacteria bacterium]